MRLKQRFHKLIAALSCAFFVQATLFPFAAMAQDIGASGPPMCGGQLTGCGECEICDGTNCWRIPDCYEACDGARCGSCEKCVIGECTLETRGNPPCQPIPGSCQDCPVELDCVTCENNICIFRGCGGPTDDDGTCTPACDTCTHCVQGQCYPDDTCEDDGSSCQGTCAACQVCRSESCVRDGRCDLDDQESNGNEGDYCDGALPCRACLQCVSGACAVSDPQACQDNLDVIITPPGPVVMGIGMTQRLRAQGGPLTGTYSWTSGNPSVARLQGSTTTQNVTVEGLAPGTATVTVSFTAQGTTVTDSVNVTVVEVKLTEVSFSGAKYHQIISDDGSTSFSAPHWRDFDLDGVPEQAYPVAFTRKTYMEISAWFNLNPSISGAVLVKGDGPGNLDIPPTSSTLFGNLINLPAETTAGPFADVVDIFYSMPIIWQVSFDNGLTWINAGTSENQVYVTWGDPKQIEPRHTLLHVGSGAAAGVSGTVGMNDNAVLDKIWGKIKTKFINRASDGVLLTYYGFFDVNGNGIWDSGIDVNYNNPAFCQNITPESLIEFGNGQCGSWARFMNEVLEAQGLSSINGVENKFVSVVIKNPNIAFGVRNWNKSGINTSRVIIDADAGVDGNTPTLPDSLANEAADAKGAPGQGNSPNPPANFGNHFIARMNNLYYDPSYGLGPFLSEKDYENAAFDGSIKENLGVYYLEDLPSSVTINTYTEFMFP